MAKRRNKSGKGEVKELVRARDQSVEAAFSNKWFLLDFYQREYVWEEQQVTRLVNDLSRKFLDQWREYHSLNDVKSYDPYFLGPYIVHSEGSKVYLVDGQQRVITLMLLLIYLQRQLTAMPSAKSKAAQFHTLIMNDRFGKKLFRVDADEYADCFDALLSGRNPHLDNAPEAIRRIWRAYLVIEAHFKEKLRSGALVLFAEWLLNRVSLVAMDAGDRTRAEEMYQSINDTGLRLSPMDLLKRFLLSDAEDPRAMEGTWTEMVTALEGVERGAAFAYLRTVLRARFPDVAQMPGPSLNDATFEWVRVHEDDIWRTREHGDRTRLVTDVLHRFHQPYGRLLTARSEFDPALPAVRYNAFNGIVEQFDLTIAALRPGDEDLLWERKAGLVANFLDLFYVTRTLYDEPVEQKDVDELVSAVMPRVRQSETPDELGRALGDHATGWPDRLDRIPELRYDTKRRFVHYVLARLTAWVEMGATNGKPDPTESFLKRREQDRDFEIEHLFTSKASEYAHKVPNEQLYKYLRSRIGGLLLLDGPENGRYGGMLLEDKLVRYRKDTRLAGMINPDFFQRSNSTLEKFLRDKGLFSMVATYDASTPLEPFIEARGRLYLEMAKHVWSLDELGLTAPAPAGPAAPVRRTRANVRFRDLVEARLLDAGVRLIGRRRGEVHYARVRPEGTIETEEGSVAASPTEAMRNVVGSARDPWSFWKVEGTDEELDVVRQRYLRRDS
ncbi:DUF262 domain-containing protein [Actinoplanes oblitus]|uniref:DUF262 domain-containing protein n=1 Tax=Actinoplanes oblitus TaxID=3040509 RepID=A0ABY8WUG7_9ACTN|nr:DUF262 domain-containing protein [Actinoplanes oblitus]WIN00611.1 DUF262 domain-containing protein [Actinoplanes oblitus]